MAATSAPRRVLIIRLSAIGDVILASGLLPALRAAWPEAELHWLTESGNAGLLEGHPRLAAVHRLPRGRWRELAQGRRYLTLAREMRQFGRQLAARRFDLVLDLQGLLKSAVWAWASRAPRRVGLGSREGSRWLLTEGVSRRVSSPLPGKEYRALLRALGLDDAPFALDIPVSPAAADTARTLLNSVGVTGEYAVIAPFTTRPQKHWFDERWAALAMRLRQDHRLPVVMLGGPGDQAHARAIAGHLSSGIVDLAGRTDLPTCAALIRGARLLVGVDTGLTHLGLAQGTPTLALFGSTRPYLEPDVPRARVLYTGLECSPCRRRPTCHGEYTCMRQHEVAAVAEAAGRLLRPSQPSGEATP